VEKFIEDTKRIYLRFDYEKADRPSKEEVKSYLNFIIRNSTNKYSKEPMKGLYDENISYDYILGDYAIKIFSFKAKELPRLISNAKLWSYNAREINEKYKSVFIYDGDIDSNNNAYYQKCFDTIIKILSENSSMVLPLKEGVNFINNPNNYKN
jgi:hypothetical protein